MSFELRTLGHATLCLLEDGVPLLATDPWLVGSAYWRSWWLEKYPSADEVSMVRRAKHIYITHSHPDHFHLPTLRHLGHVDTLHPHFPGYSVPGFLRENGFRATELRPRQWYPLGRHARMMSVPVPVDDSVLVIETPNATILDLNDAHVPSMLVKRLVGDVFAPQKPIIVLKSYSPASSGVATFRDGRRVPHKTGDDYARAARGIAERFGAHTFVPFASQVFFSRQDSRWANEYKVTYEKLVTSWEGSPVRLVPPFVSMDLDTLAFTSSYADVRRTLTEERSLKVADRETEEAEFVMPDDFDARLKKYIDETPLFRVLCRRGIGWKLSTSGTERFANFKTGKIEQRIPRLHDFTITLPDKVLYESLCNNILTDLGITMFIRVDTNIGLRRTYAAFLLMGLHDYGHSRDLTSIARLLRFYVPTIFGRKPDTRGVAFEPLTEA